MSAYNPNIHHRKSIRLQKYDYASNGAYFVTICTYEKKELFGEIKNGIMGLNKFGCIVANELLYSSEIRQEIILDEWIIMSNHIHIIVFLVGAHGYAPSGIPYSGIPDSDLPSATRAHNHAPLRRLGKSLPSFIAGFKFGSTSALRKLPDMQNRKIWQRNYYERIIRSESELFAIRQYILDNPLNWANDSENH